MYPYVCVIKINEIHTKLAIPHYLPKSALISNGITPSSQRVLVEIPKFLVTILFPCSNEVPVYMVINVFNYNWLKPMYAIFIKLSHLKLFKGNGLLKWIQSEFLNFTYYSFYLNRHSTCFYFSNSMFVYQLFDRMIHVHHE
jgi:hypothetical protein